MKNNIVLTGMPGSGKTTVGRELAKRLEREFADTDERLERETGLSIAEIFKIHGEEYFRQLEYEKIKELMQRSAQVISIGGGAFEDAQSRSLLLKNAVVIYLKTSVETLTERIKHETHRPLTNIRELYAKRRGNYAKARYTIDTERKTPYNIVEEILRLHGN